jgi:hypothetical protein
MSTSVSATATMPALLTPWVVTLPVMISAAPSA